MFALGGSGAALQLSIGTRLYDVRPGLHALEGVAGTFRLDATSYPAEPSSRCR